MEEPLQHVAEHHAGTQRDAARVHGAHDRVDHVRAGLEDVWPDVVKQVHQRVLAAEPRYAERHVLHRTRRRLAMHQVAVHQRVLQQRRHCVDVVLPHLADVLEQKAQRLEHPVLHVELRHPVLVHERGQDGEGRAGLRDDGDGDGGAHSVLPLLHLEVVQQRHQHILRPDRLGDVPKRVHRRSADALLVRLEHFEELKANAHPFARGHKLGAAVGDASDEVDAVLLHLLVPVLQDGRQAGEEVLDGRRHLGHADHVDNALERAQDGAQHLGVLFAEVLVEHDAKVPHQRLLPALFHDARDARDEVRRLLSYLGALVVEAPLDGAADLREVGLGARAERVDDGTKAAQHHVRLVLRLLLKRVQDAVDEELLKPRVHVRRPQRLHHLVHRLHHHPTVRLALVLQILHHAAHDLRAPHLVGNLHSGLHQLSVVAAVQRHPTHPKIAEKLGQDLRFDVVPLHAVRAHALLHHLEHDLLHLLVRALKLADEDHHGIFCVIVGVRDVHERDDEADGLEEGGQHLSAVAVDAAPQRLEDAVEGLDAVRGGGLGEGGDGEGADGAHLLVLILESVLNDLHQRGEVRQHSAAHEDGNLLTNFDARVARLPTLFALTHRFQKRQQRGDAEGGGDHAEGARGGVADVLVDVVNVGAHRGDHGRQAGSL
mmetsp:Transcript_30967/g.55423  ORF Transcript_30967/g.55423 Transcript_30967/m.55423 type:complete len:657 (+) Transcript_30967:141-2111(+)